MKLIRDFIEGWRFARSMTAWVKETRKMSPKELSFTLIGYPIGLPVQEPLRRRLED